MFIFMAYIKSYGDGDFSWSNISQTEIDLDIFVSQIITYLVTSIVSYHEEYWAF